MNLREELRKNSETYDAEFSRKLQEAEQKKVHTWDDFYNVIEPYLSDLLRHYSKSGRTTTVTFGSFFWKDQHRCIKIPCQDIGWDHGVVPTNLQLRGFDLYINSIDIYQFCKYHNLTLIYEIEHSVVCDDEYDCHYQYSYSCPKHCLNLKSYLIEI